MYQFNSKKIKPGDTFLCLPKGEKHLEEAMQNEASDYIVLNRPEMAKLAAKHYNYPSKKLTVIGITGTKGKTTTSYLLKAALELAGFKPYVLGTLNSDLTTPESLDTQRLMAEHLKNKGTHFIMEVSSQGIAQHRIDQIDFDIKIFTNISLEHLDLHGTFANYKKIKMGFMRKGKNIKIYPQNWQTEKIWFKHNLLGEFNAQNLKTAICALKKLNLKEKIIGKALSNISIPGRFETINQNQDFLVVVDFAHTPDSLKNTLQTAKEITLKQSSRLLTLIGCGGNRDRQKRPLMAKIAADLSDYFIITQDNPRAENPAQIIDDMLKGVPQDTHNYQVINDRRQAIHSLINQAKTNDVVIIAGKGHETYQIIGHQKHPFDDRVEARLALKKKKNANRN